MARSSSEKTPKSSAQDASSSSNHGKGRSSSVMARSAKTPGNVLSSLYLERHSNKNDLVRRLRAVVEALSDEDVEANSPDYPGLAGLAAALVEDRYLNHRDKEVRLHTVLACMEIFYLYAPEPPWDEAEILRVFSQLIRQLANLSHCTSPTQTNFSHYFRLLEQLSAVKIGVVLVELTRTLESAEPSPDGTGESFQGASSEEALEMLTELMRTILQSVNIDHPPDVLSHAVSAVSACIEEFDGTIPIPVLDEILTCISAGPVVYVTNPAAVEAAAAAAAAAKKKGQKAETDNKTKMPPMQIQQTNQSYMVAAAIIRRTEDRISTPIANLLNGILNGDTNVMKQTSISAVDVPTTDADATAGGPFPGSTSAAQSTPSADVWTLIYELHRIAPQILTTVIGNVASSLQSPNIQKRFRVTKLLGKLFYSPTSDIGVRFGACYREWIRRSTDVEQKIRLTMVKCLIQILSNKGKEEMLCREATTALIGIIEQDPNLDVRLTAIHQVCDLAYNEKSFASSLTGYGNEVASSGGSSAARSTSTATTAGEPAVISARLLRAVGNRVSSKNKTERRDAVTGLAQIYYRHYLSEKLKLVQSGGDDCDIGIILDVLHDTCFPGDNLTSGRGEKTRSGKISSKAKTVELHDVEEKYGWIPTIVFESACFTDKVDPEMRNRVVQIVDDVLLGPGNSSGSQKEDGRNKQPLTPTSQAVGLAVIMNSLRAKDDNDAPQGGITSESNLSNAEKWMRTLLAQRASLQRALGRYIDARAKVKQFTPGSEEALTADAEAFEQLEIVASLTAPVSSSGSSSSSSPSDLLSVLQKLHTARDKHIFRILASIASPTHSPSARARAFDELPKRTKSLGNTASTWIKSLARRCAMGNFVNVDIITHCVLLAQECFHEEDLKGTMSFLSCVKTAVAIYPMLGATKEGFGTLVELFGECRGVNSVIMKKEMDDHGIITVLSRILAAAAPARAASSAARVKSLQISPASKKKEGESENGIIALDSELYAQLLHLCTRDGTPEQAKHAVYTLAALSNPHAQSAGSGSSPHGLSLAEATRGEREAFNPLLRALTSPSRMTLTASDRKSRIVSILAALAALADCAPAAFSDTGGKGYKAIRFALESALLGRSHSPDGDEEGDINVDESSDDEEGSPSVAQSKRRLSQRRRKSKEKTGLSASPAKGGKADDDEPSLTCRRLCAAIELLVSHVRSTIIKIKAINLEAKQKIRSTSKENKKDSKAHKTRKDEEAEMPKVDDVLDVIRPPSSEHITTVFSTLIQILQHSGLPPSNQDWRACRSSRDRAVLRQCAAINLLRLCDPSLLLERKYLTPGMWHVLSGVFLDEEKSVRESVMEELSLMLTGQGKYRRETPSGSSSPGGGVAFAPSLRFLAIVVFCADAEHGHGHSASNGNAAYVGRRSNTVKQAALQCITNLRRTCDTTLAQCRAIGRDAERNFESQLKCVLMPEFAAPFAFHLLSFRRESPGAGGTKAGSETTSLSQASVQMEENEVNEEELVADEEGRHRMLRKRLKWLLEPLVQSLGDSADNISFLLRIAELLGKQFQPIDVVRDVNPDAAGPPQFDTSKDSSLGSPISPFGTSVDKSVPDSVSLSRGQALAAKLQVICAAAREVLLAFVKKDVNLTPYPGAIQIPFTLFKRAAVFSQPNISDVAEKSRTAKPVASLAKKRQRNTRSPVDGTPGSSKAAGTGSRGHVHFSPELERYHEHDTVFSVSDVMDEESGVESELGPVNSNANRRRSPRLLKSPLPSPRKNHDDVSSPDCEGGNEDGFGGLSPIAKSDSPSSFASRKRSSRRNRSKGADSEHVSRVSLLTQASKGTESLASIDAANSTQSTPVSGKKAKQTGSDYLDKSDVTVGTPTSAKEARTPESTPRESTADSATPTSSGRKRHATESGDGSERKRPQKKRSSPVPIQIKISRPFVVAAKQPSAGSAKATKRASPQSKKLFSRQDGVVGTARRRDRTMAPRVLQSKKDDTDNDEFDFHDDDEVFFESADDEEEIIEPKEPARGRSSDGSLSRSRMKQVTRPVKAGSMRENGRKVSLPIRKTRPSAKVQKKGSPRISNASSGGTSTSESPLKSRDTAKVQKKGSPRISNASSATSTSESPLKSRDSVGSRRKRSKAADNVEKASRSSPRRSSRRTKK